MKYLPPIGAMLFSLFMTLCALVFCMGMGANAKPDEIRQLKFWMAGFSLLGVAGIVVGIVLMRSGQMGNAALAGIAPAVVVLAVFVVAMLK